MKYHLEMTLLYMKREWLMFQLITVLILDRILSAILPKE
jgi:hypothetical protein